LFLQLVRCSDVVVENYKVGVMERLGLGYETLAAAKSNLVVLTMPGFGLTGPERDYISWADTLEGLAGYCQVTGYEGGPPMCNFQGHSDSLAGVMGAAAVLTALAHRDAT